MKMTARIEGGDELLAQFRQLKDTSQRADVLRESALDGAGVIQQQANHRAPGPHVETEVERVTRTQATVNIGPDEDHWYYKFFETGAEVHLIRPREQRMLFFEDFGTADQVFTPRAKHPGIPARPFLRPALDENTERASQETGKTLRRKLGL